MNRKGEWRQNLPQKFGLIGEETANHGLKKKKRDREEEGLAREEREESAKRLRVGP